MSGRSPDGVERVLVTGATIAGEFHVAGAVLPFIYPGKISYTVVMVGV